MDLLHECESWIQSQNFSNLALILASMKLNLKLRNTPKSFVF